MTHGSLFSGIGCAELASSWMGWENKFHCDIAEVSQRTIKHYWPESESYGDITKTDFTIWRGRIDILTGSFPCQDVSNGKQHGARQLGLEGDRTGLWREMVRAIEEIQPRYVRAENVSAILSTNDGRDFRSILNELARLGYNAEWRVTRASEVGACHHRSRMYLVAYPRHIRLQENESFFAFVDSQKGQERRRIAGTTASVGVSWPPQPEFSGVDDGLSKRLVSESIKAYGNTIMPQIDYAIFQAIQAYEDS
jgi:DNA (cytosine-5)-methyltransferase 1